MTHHKRPIEAVYRDVVVARWHPTYRDTPIIDALCDIKHNE